jgi:hypothetical protein
VCEGVAFHEGRIVGLQQHVSRRAHQERAERVVPALTRFAGDLKGLTQELLV